MKSPSIRADLSFNLIQSIRLMHAVSETNTTLVIPESEAWKFTELTEQFGMDFEIGDSGDASLSGLASFSHSTPICNVGKATRPLIFPHRILHHCRSLWPNDRVHKFVFAGLITPSRRTVISRWLMENFSYSSFALRLAWLRNRWSRTPITFHTASDESLFIDSSNRGRHFPLKCWDEKYFRLLSNSQFVLCPSGDFIWTYRFFEAILCGAIPVVEEACEPYEGFEFLSLSDSPANCSWSPEIAERNYQLCLERISVPLDELNNEVSDYLGEYVV